MLYLGCAIAFLDFTSTTVMRSMITKIVPIEEIARVFCIVEFCKGIIKLAGPVAYLTLYKHTVRNQPNAFLFLGSGLKLVVFISVSIIFFSMRKQQNKSSSSMSLKGVERSERMNITPNSDRQNSDVSVHPTPS